MSTIRNILIKLFRMLGSDNPHERDNARGLIDDLLRKSKATWGDLPGLLGVGDPELAHNIAGLGSQDPDERRNARKWIAHLLARTRKNWNDLTDSDLSWADGNTDGRAHADIPLPDLIRRVLEWYLHFQHPYEYVAVTLWILHTHVFRRFRITPRIALTSPTSGCGKTTLLDVLNKLVARPLKMDSVTPAIMYHSIDYEHPTMLVDEVDNLGFPLVSRGDLRAVFNSGHKYDGTISRMQGGQPCHFSTFSPLAVAGIGTFPQPLMERSIVIAMQKYAGKEKLKEFDEEEAVELDYIYQQACVWAKTVTLERNPVMPPELRNRQTDNWRPLIAIADSFGPEWGRLAREAAVAYARNTFDEDAKIILLHDIRTIFDRRGGDRLFTVTLLADLHAMEDAIWGEWRGVRGNQQPRPLSQGEMARLLSPFKIKSRTIWPLNRIAGGKSAKGYHRSQFEAVWQAYCPEDGTASQANNIRALRAARGTGA
jgi:hypothetical protein